MLGELVMSVDIISIPVTLLCELYLQCGSCICSLTYMKYVYSAPCCAVDVSDFICRTNV